MAKVVFIYNLSIPSQDAAITKWNPKSEKVFFFFFLPAYMGFCTTQVTTSTAPARKNSFLAIKESWL